VGSNTIFRDKSHRELERRDKTVDNRKIIGSRIRVFDWYRYRWPWNDPERRNSPYCALFHRIW